MCQFFSCLKPEKKNRRKKMEEIVTGIITGICEGIPEAIYTYILRSEGWEEHKIEDL